jgi:hypothetical protein
MLAKEISDKLDEIIDCLPAGSNLAAYKLGELTAILNRRIDEWEKSESLDGLDPVYIDFLLRQRQANKIFHSFLVTPARMLKRGGIYFKLYEHNKGYVVCDGADKYQYFEEVK